jgi:hypothetical protein
MATAASPEPATYSPPPPLPPPPPTILLPKDEPLYAVDPCSGGARLPTLRRSSILIPLLFRRVNLRPTAGSINVAPFHYLFKHLHQRYTIVPYTWDDRGRFSDPSWFLTPHQDKLTDQKQEVLSTCQQPSSSADLRVLF